MSTRPPLPVLVELPVMHEQLAASQGFRNPLDVPWRPVDLGAIADHAYVFTMCMCDQRGVQVQMVRTYCRGTHLVRSVFVGQCHCGTVYFHTGPWRVP